ncbi:MAG: tRNA (adenosine(37)-N6)-threonylcarbamoyltransferase complex dimerization subunit type 1 TsaB [Planctomycetes bacterium]|nr:tRNA (adenosine(37)-N6)-threonylcarbamoyltransferase complex dimerization subunit type 1 TsaB [Planctomycetota bacterium]
MRIIAIETSGRHGSVAALNGVANEARVLRQIALGGDERTAQALAPAMRELLNQVGWTPQSVELVTVAVGPGSFTGLRIGVTTAKTFAYAVGAHAIGVSTLAALAAQAPPSCGPLWTILDAQRQELFVAKFDAHEHRGDPIDCNTLIVGRNEWLSQLQPGDCVIGPALRTLRSRLPDGVVAAPEELWQPMAIAVGRVAWRAYRSGKRDDVWTLAPQYYRASAAEEKLS